MLGEHFASVTIVDRDDLPDSPVARRGAPQANHNHVLLLRGRQIMEELFPGLQDAVIRDSGILLDMANDLAWYTPWGWGVRFESPLRMLACSRALLEWCLRQMLVTSHHVQFVTNTGVDSLAVHRGRVRACAQMPANCAPTS